MLPTTRLAVKNYPKERDMREIPVSELRLIASPESIPTVEVDIDSIPESLFFDDLIYDGLTPYSKKYPNEVATIYIYESQSINFHEQTYSAFIGIAGHERLLKVILGAFKSIPDVQARFSDYIGVRQGMAKFQIQDGEVWQPVDLLTWYTGTSENPAESPEEDWGEPEKADSLEIEESNERSNGPRSNQGLRFRQARSDASIGSIKGKIEKIFGLPEGSIQICGPKGNALRSDAKISTLRKRWDY